MSDDKAVRPAGEPPIRNQSDVFAQTRPHDSAGGCEHLRHAGATLRSFVSDNDDHSYMHVYAFIQIDWLRMSAVEVASATHLP